MKNQNASDVVAHPGTIHHSLQVIVSFKAQKSKLYVLFSLHNLMRIVCVHITLTHHINSLVFWRRVKKKIFFKKKRKKPPQKINFEVYLLQAQENYDKQKIKQNFGSANPTMPWQHFSCSTKYTNIILKTWETNIIFSLWREQSFKLKSLMMILSDRSFQQNFTFQWPQSSVLTCAQNYTNVQLLLKHTEDILLKHKRWNSGNRKDTLI